MKITSDFVKQIWHRLPRIALYSLAFYIIFFVGQEAFNRFMPARYFLDYYSVNVPQDVKIYEHEPIPVNICRNKKADYPVQGYRIFYKLRDDRSRSNAEQVANVPFDNQITPNKCVSLRLTKQVYDHTEGTYFYRTVLNFKVGGYGKQIRYESNNYVVEKRTLTNDEMQKRIEELEKEITDLKRQLLVSDAGVEFIPEVEPAPPTPTPVPTAVISPQPSVQSPLQSSQQKQVANSSEPKTRPEQAQASSQPQTPPRPQPQPEPAPFAPTGIPLVDSVLRLLTL